MADRLPSIFAVGGTVDVPVGVHACCWFDEPAQRRSVVREFVRLGLDRGERVAVYLRDGAAPVLDLTAPDLAARVDDGQLLVGSAEEAYFPHGDFDGPQRVADFAAFAAETAAAGFPALRVYADNGPMPRMLPTPDDWLEYELRVALTIPRFPLIGLCGFSAIDRPALPFELLDAVHERNLSPGSRMSEFRVYGDPDGTLIVAGEVERVVLDNLRRLLTAAAPVLEHRVVSLRDVTFADGAAAKELHRLSRMEGVTLVDVPVQVRHVWEVLGLSAA